MCVILHMSVVTQNGMSALMLAAKEGKTEVVVELVKAGANVDLQNRVRHAIYIYVTHDTWFMHYIHPHCDTYIVCTYNVYM